MSTALLASINSKQMCADTRPTTNMKQDAGRSSSKCSRRGSELLVEWPSPVASTEQDQKDNGGQWEVSSSTTTMPSSIDTSTITSCTAGAHSITSSENYSGQQKSQRSIHFSPKVHVTIIPSLNDYSLERLEKIYYSKDDLADQRAEYVATAKEMHRRHRRGEDPLQVHELKIRQENQQQPSILITSATTRGLEHMASRRTMERHRREQRDIISAVLVAQENNFTPEEIAIIYGHRARSAKRRARCYGLADAELAE